MMMDTSSDHGSDGTDELLTSLDPLLNQSNQLVLESSREEKSFTSSISHRSFSDDLPTQASKYKRMSPISPPFDPRHASAAEILARTERQLQALDNDRKSTGGGSTIDNYRPVKDNHSKEVFRLNLTAFDDRNGDAPRNGLRGERTHSNGKVNQETLGKDTKFRCRAFKEDESSEKLWSPEADPNRHFAAWSQIKSWSQKVEETSLWSQKEPGTKLLYQKESESKFQHQKEPGTEFQYQKEPESIFQYQKEPGTEFQYQKEPGTKFHYEKEPGTKFHYEKEPGTKFQYQKEPGTRFQYQKEPESKFQYQKEPESKFQYQKEPGTKFQYEKEPESKFQYQKEPGTQSLYQKEPGTKFQYEKEPESKLWSQKEAVSKPFSPGEAQSNIRPQKWTESRSCPSNYEHILQKDVQDKLDGVEAARLQRDLQDKLDGVDTAMKTRKDEFRTLLSQMEADKKPVRAARHEARVLENGDGFRGTLRSCENVRSRESPRLRAQIESLSKECAATSQELKNAEAKVMELRGEVAQLRAACDKKEQLLHRRESELSAAAERGRTRENEKDDAIAGLRKELQVAETEVRHLRGGSYKLEAMLEDARDAARQQQEAASAAVSQARERLQREAEDAKRLRAELADRADEAAELRRRMKAGQEEQRRLEADLEQERARRTAAEGERKEAAQRSQQLEAVVGDLRQAMDRAQLELDRWRSREQRWSDEKSLLTEELRALDAQGAANLERLRSEMTARMDKERAEILSAQETARSHVEQALRASHRDELHALVERHQKELSELREKADVEIGHVLEQKDTALTELRTEMTQLHERNDSLRRQKCEAEAQRLQTLSQMQHLMQANCRDALNLLKPVPDGNEVAALRPAGSDVTNLLPVANDVTNLRPAASDVTAIRPAPSDVTNLRPAASDVTAIRPAPSDVTNLRPVANDVTNLRSTASDVISLRSAASDVSAPRRVSSDVTTSRLRSRPPSSAASDGLSPRGRPDNFVHGRPQPTLEAGDDFDIIDSLLRPPEPPQNDLIVFTPRPASKTAS